MQEFQLTGLCAATITPFHPDGRVNLEQVGPIVQHLIQSGVTGLYVCGSTGEGVSLTVAERMAITEAYVNAAAGRLPVVVQVGHNSLETARELAVHAAAVGADAVSANCPSYFKIDAVSVLVEAITSVATRVPNLPFYYYHIPALTGVNVDMVEFLRQASPKNPNLVGLKFTNPALDTFQQCFEVDGQKFDVLWGVDEMLLGALATGASGSIGSTYNIAAPAYLRIIEAFQQGDLETARHWQLQCCRLIRILASYPFHAALREVFRLQGYDTGKCRLPIRALTADECRSLANQLEEIDFFAWCGTDADQKHLRIDRANNGQTAKSPANSNQHHERI